MSEVERTCLLNLDPSERSCVSCEKLRECQHGMKVILEDTSLDTKNDPITRGINALSEEDSSLAELRSGPCLLGYPPILRSCATCSKLYECLHGQKVTDKNTSITDKVLKLDWIITDTSRFNTMTLDQLVEYNTARDTYEKRGLGRKRNQTLTVGFYDRERKKWVTNVQTGVDAMKVEDSVGKGLTAGYYDREKKRWVAKK